MILNSKELREKLSRIDDYVKNNDSDMDKLARIIVNHHNKENRCELIPFASTVRSREVGLLGTSGAAEIILSFIDKHLEK